MIKDGFKITIPINLKKRLRHSKKRQQKNNMMDIEGNQANFEKGDQEENQSFVGTPEKSKKISHDAFLDLFY